jgi:hypothetical protein
MVTGTTGKLVGRENSGEPGRNLVRAYKAARRGMQVTPRVEARESIALRPVARKLTVAPRIMRPSKNKAIPVRAHRKPFAPLALAPCE